MQDYSAPKKMKTVGDLFLKYELILKPPQASVEKAFVDEVKSVLGFDLNPAQVKYNVATKTIGLSVPSILKTEIRFKQKNILSNLRLKLGVGNSPESIV